MAKDPLSVSPVVLPQSKIPSIAQGIMSQRIAMEQDRHARDAEKMATLNRLATVEAIGWEKDQRDIDEAIKAHEDTTTQIMIKSNGVPSPSELRQIERSKSAIESIAKTSVEDKKAMVDNMKWIANHHKDLDVEGAMRGLEDYYAQPVTQRSLKGPFDVSPYIQPESYTDSEVLDMLPGGIKTEVTKGDKYKRREDTIDEEAIVKRFDSNLATDSKTQRWYNEKVKAGVFDSPESAKSYLIDQKRAESKLRNESLKIKEAAGKEQLESRKNHVVTDTMTGSKYEFSEYTPISGVSKSININYNGNTVSAKPDGFGATADGLMAAVTITVNDPVYVSYDKYKQIQRSDPSAALEYVPVGDKYLLKGSNKNQRKTVVIPYDDISEDLVNSIKNFRDITDMSKEEEEMTQKQVEAKKLRELSSKGGLKPGEGVLKYNPAQDTMMGIMGMK